MFQVDFKPPGLEEARKVQSEIKRLGIQDVEIKWDNEFGVWCVVQIKKSTNQLVTMDSLIGTDAQPYLLWYCQNKKDGGYRPPNQEDIQSLVAIVRESHHWWEKGGDAFVDEVENRDEQRRQKKVERQLERAKPHIKALKKAIREELG